ncbi:MAG: S41 family peptidase [Candidatus Levybacteria bacterium]|nr:S41 family peptidase [Candidatus Levybacteria bacterium]
MKTQKIRIIFIIFISFFLGYYFGVTKISLEWKSYKPQISIINKEPPSNVSSADFSLLWNVMQKIENSYYDKKAINAQKLLYGAVTGMVQSLDDPYTVFLPPNQNSDFKQGMAGQFEGIGAELGMNGKQIIVVAPLDGTPAKKAGIRAGDAILKVDDKPTYGWTISQAVEKIRGQRGTKVALTILHKGEEDEKVLEIVRETITVKSVDGWIKKVKDIDNIKTDKINNKKDIEIAYIRLSQFGDNTNQDWTALVSKLSPRINSGSNVKGLIFDLRNNPGGYLTDATFIASEFIKSGTVVIQEKNEADKNVFSVSREGMLTNVPVIVLINKGSASASEIVAGALKDHKRAKLIGETSFGKGTIQQAEDLGNGAGLHVTIAKWLTPNGTWVNGKGLNPDISVSIDKNNQKHDTQLEKAVEELVK